ncbi:lysosomal acid glucosylceramidase-like [Achroia grisella]|uniref:lysosomal acid glucosylceramidase-like n=1 Tax=Achroia grisella TaxID=688607 RepID=UPI0027D24C46|nr:lysosomal acid glucosylceramidase-like [Achroia grisella]
MLLFNYILLISLFITLCIVGIYSDIPCAARQITGQSVVCVCNATYCDQTTRTTPNVGAYVAYTSSEAGARFKKTTGLLEISNNLLNHNESQRITTLAVNPQKLFQTIEGFGGAVTDSAAINWSNFTDIRLKEDIIKSYFSSTGIEYNMVRVPIGGSDFSTRPYAYNEVPEYDVNLTNFNLTREDYDYKIPMLKAIKKDSPIPVHVIGTTWSPPGWMKSNHALVGASHLLPQYYQTYADYHLKFVQKYKEVNINIWGITTTNEPINGDFGTVRFNSLGWTAKNMGRWIADFLGPTIRNSEFNKLKILAVDDQRITLPYFFGLMIKERPTALQYIDGIAVHYYFDAVSPPELLTLISKYYPDKFIISTEACVGSNPWESQKVILGSWQRAYTYIHDIFQDLNYNLVGWLDWNLCLNKEGGPNWAGNMVDSPIIVDAENGEFLKQPTYYAMGHFSKFVPRGSRRVEVTQSKPFYYRSLLHVAFLTPYKTVVVIIYNKDSSTRPVKVKVGNYQEVSLILDAKSITTIELRS